MPSRQQIKFEGIIKGSGLVIPDDFVLPDLSYIRSRVASTSKKGNVDKIAYDFVKFVFKDKGIAEAIPLGFNEDLSNSIIITSAAYLAEALLNVEPSIKCVSDLTGKDRNFVAAFAKGLANGHLVDLREKRREELIEPTLSGLAFNDIVLMNGAWTARALEETARELKSGVKVKAVERLEDLEIAFHMAKKAYNKDTLNFKIMEELHKHSTELLVNGQEGNVDLVLEKVAYLVTTLNAMSETRKKARKLGLRPTVLEATGEEVGKARVYQLK